MAGIMLSTERANGNLSVRSREKERNVNQFISRRPKITVKRNACMYIRNILMEKKEKQARKS